MRSIHRIGHWLGRVNRPIVRSMTALAMLCLASMTAVTLLQVFCRYVLNAPLSWPEEAARFLMVWMTYLVAPYAYREGLFVRLESVLAAFPVALRRVFDALAHLLVIATSAVLLERTLWMVDRGHAIQATALDIPMSAVFAVMPLSLLALIAVALELLLREPPNTSEQSSPSADASAL